MRLKIIFVLLLLAAAAGCSVNSLISDISSDSYEERCAGLGYDMYLEASTGAYCVNQPLNFTYIG